MSESKKRRSSLLDGLATAASPAPLSPMMSSNRALRAARDAVDGHHVWDLDPTLVEDGRPIDRLDHDDIDDLRDAIETNGQTVPILVRRHPQKPDRYLLVYGRRRLEAVRSSEKVKTVRALVAHLDDDAAIRSQISENMARRDLTYIEKALFARELVESGFGTQVQVAEVLTVTKSSISMGISIAEGIGPDLARAIGPAPGIGRPRWDALAQAIDTGRIPRDRLIGIAEEVHVKAEVAAVTDGVQQELGDISVMAFDAVLRALEVAMPKAKAGQGAPSGRAATLRLSVGEDQSVALSRTAKGLRLDIEEGGFADWMEREAERLVKELHARWLKGAED